MEKIRYESKGNGWDTRGSDWFRVEPSGDGRDLS